MQHPLKTLTQCLSCVVLALALSSCGWQLRGYQQYTQLGEQKIDAVDLKAASDHRLFESTLERQLKDLTIAIDEQAELTLYLHSENTERRPLSYGSTGIPIQYQLIMRVKYGVANKLDPKVVDRTLTARREYDFDTSLVVAKDEEQRQLLQEMREELAMRIIASLSQR